MNLTFMGYIEGSRSREKQYIIYFTRFCKCIAVLGVIVKRQTLFRIGWKDIITYILTSTLKEDSNSLIMCVCHHVFKPADPATCMQYLLTFFLMRVGCSTKLLTWEHNTDVGPRTKLDKISLHFLFKHFRY